MGFNKSNGQIHINVYQLQECISQSAVQTKFAQHTDNGKLIISDVKCIMEDVLKRTNTTRYIFYTVNLGKHSACMVRIQFY